MLKAIGNFLFGKNPDIFDSNGHVVHKLPKKTWDMWQDKMKSDPQNNWRHHKGTLAGQGPRKKT